MSSNVSERHAGGMPPSEHADWVLDLGPGGGVNGGEIVAEGTPEKVVTVAGSFTGQYLKPLLERASVRPEFVVGQLSKPRKRAGETKSEQPDLLTAN